LSSPASTAKSLESAFISALKRYFESSSRIIRTRDFFALAIDETITHFPQQEDDTSLRKQPNTISWYRVEKVTIGKQEYTGDVHVDPGCTKMLQSYYSASTIPLTSMGLYSYLGIPHLPVPNDDSLDRIRGYSRLKVLAEATLSTFGRDVNLNLLSILIHGQRGVGKKTMAEWVATRLGLHYFEVSFFSKVVDDRLIVMIS
jgi:peroxin-6